MCDGLRRHEPRAWAHFASPAGREKLAGAARLELLQTAYRIDRASWPEWYAAAEQTAAALGLNVPVALYQAQASRGLGAAPAAILEEAHLVLHGQPATRLADGQFRALLAHALSHVLLWRADGDLLPAEQALNSLTAQPDASQSYRLSARRFALMTKVVCDRGSLGVAGDPSVVIALLARLEAEQAGRDAGAQEALTATRRVFSCGQKRCFARPALAPAVPARTVPRSIICGPGPFTSGRPKAAHPMSWSSGQLPARRRSTTWTRSIGSLLPRPLAGC